MSLRTTHDPTVLASLATWSYDPDASFADPIQLLPFGGEFQAVMEPAMTAGAIALCNVEKTLTTR